MYIVLSSNIDACWIIQSEARIQIHADRFNLQPQNADGDCLDYVKIYDDEDRKRIPYSLEY